MMNNMRGGSSSSSAGAGHRFRSGEPMDERESNRTWEALKDAIHQIHAHNASQLSFEELYRNAYNLVLHKYGELLYNGVQGVVQEHLSNVANDKLVDCADEGLLGKLKEVWDEHKTVMVMIRDILMYMDRNFVTQFKKIPVYEMGLCTFRDTVSGHEKVADRLLRIMLMYVSEERDGRMIDRMLLKHTVTMLVELGVQNRNIYRECFEDWYIDEAAKFYKNESLNYISENTVPDFLKRAEQRIKEEKSRVHNYLHDSTLDRIQTTMDEEWIIRHHEALIKKNDTGCKAMFLQEKKDDLKRMYMLFSRQPSTLKGVHKVMIECIKEAGKAILDDPQKKEPVTFIDSLLKLKDKYASFVADSFNDSKEFQISLKTAFEECLNVDTQTSMNLSLYVDNLFRQKTSQGDNEIDKQLERVVSIFRYLQDKDIFESYYKQYFAKRLLSANKLTSDDHEKLMLSKLKSECGHQYTQKLEGMLNDIKTSHELTDEFKGKNTGTNGIRVDMKLNILTSGYWPSVNYPGSCTLPTPLQDTVKRFEEFYNGKHQGRKLTWNHCQGQADLKAFLPSGKSHEFNVSTYQMCILWQFNNAPQLSYNELLANTKIPVEEFKRHLQSLYVHPKLKVLVKTNATNPNESAGSADASKAKKD